MKSALDYVKSPMIFHQIYCFVLFCFAYRGSTPVNLYDILLHSFHHKITTLSHISQILEKVVDSSARIHSELKSAGKNLLSRCDIAIDDDDTRKKSLSLFALSFLLILCLDNIKSKYTVHFCYPKLGICTYEVEMLTEPYV